PIYLARLELSLGSTLSDTFKNCSSVYLGKNNLLNLDCKCLDSLLLSLQVTNSFAAMGIVLLFSAGHSALTVSSAPYPPFGLASVWFVGFASYLLFVGIYFTALSVARDAELRRLIRKYVERQSTLLDSIGTSE